MKLPSKDSALGRALFVLGYQIVAVILGYLLNPEFVKAVAQYYPQIASFLVLAAPVLSLLRNIVRKDVPNV